MTSCTLMLAVRFSFSRKVRSKESWEATAETARGTAKAEGGRIEALSAVNAPFVSAASVGEVSLVNPRTAWILVTRELLHSGVCRQSGYDREEKTHEPRSRRGREPESPFASTCVARPTHRPGSHRESSIVAHARHRHGLVRVAAEKKYTERLGKGGRVHKGRARCPRGARGCRWGGRYGRGSPNPSGTTS